MLTWEWVAGAIGCVAVPLVFGAGLVVWFAECCRDGEAVEALLLAAVILCMAALPIAFAAGRGGAAGAGP